VKPRIAFLDLDNLQNNYFNMARCAHESGLDARVLLPSEAGLPDEHRMAWNAAGVPVADPPWVERVDACPLTPRGFRTAAARRLLARVRQFDVLFCSGQGAFWGAWSGRPFAFVSYGADLDQLAFQGWSGDPAEHSRDSLLRTSVFRMRGWLYRRSLRKARLSVIAPYQWSAAGRVGLRDFRWFNHIVDTSVLRPLSAEERRTHREAMGISDQEQLVLIPSRLNWTRPRVADHKGSDVLIRAVAAAASRFSGLRLVLVRKGWDIGATESLVRELHLEDRTRWVEAMPKARLAAFYSASDLVLDQFGPGILALVAVEAMACGVSVLTRTPAASPAPFYDEAPPPIFFDSPQALNARIAELLARAPLREELGRAGLSWVRRNCSAEVVSGQIDGMARELAGGA
jgi:glycosyltransferase involved in cell wall biosynthesis